MASSSITPLTVILTGDENWHVWIALLKTRAIEAKVWVYINPNNEEGSLLFTQLREPTLADVHQPQPAGSAITVSDLSTNEFTYFQSLQSKYEKKESALARMSSLIQASIEKNLVTYTLNCATARDMLLNLKAQFCANATVRERQLLAEYHKYKTISSTESIPKWIQNWEIAYTKCKEINASEVDGSKPLFDFISAIQEQLPGFHTAWYFRILREGDSLKIQDLIQELKDYLRDLKPAPRRGRHTGFASFQDQGSNPQSPQKPLFKPCVCGENHWYSQCYYLNHTIRQSGWRPSPEIEKAIQDKMRSNPRIKANVDKFKKKLQNQANSNTQSNIEPPALTTALFASTAFTASKLEWNLYNSFILDSGATTHICHTRNRFHNFKPTSEQLITAGTPLEIQGYGDVTITVQRENGPIQVVLRDTAYIPQCTINMVSCYKVFRAGVIWDHQNNRLTQKNYTWCTLTQINHLYVVEHNPTTSQQGAFLSKKFIKSTKPKPDQEVSIQMLHRRFAHAGLTATNQIPASTQGIKLSNPGDHFECEVCHLAKGTKIIRREPVPPPRAPYEVVALDLIEFKLVNQDAGYAKYILHFYCRFSGMNHIYILSLKREELILNTIKEFSEYTKRRWQLPIRVLQTDGETGIGSTTKHWLSQQGITLNRSPPFTQDQNGGAERSGGVIITMARAIHIDSELPGFMWPEVVTATGYLLNRTPRQKYNWKTPIEILQTYLDIKDPKPKCGHIRVFGCRAYPLIQNQPKLNKLDPRCSIGYLVGWDSTNIFRIWIPSLQKVIRTRDVTFDESIKYSPHQVELPLPQPIIEVLELITLTETDTADRISNSSEGTILPIPSSIITQPIHSKSNIKLSVAETSSESPGLITPESTPTPELTPHTELAGPLQAPSEPADTLWAPSDPPQLPSSLEASPNTSETTPQPTLETQLELEATIIVDTTQPIQTRATRDRSQGVNPSNIVEQPRTRKPSARKAAYMAALESATEIASYHTAFLAGTQFKAQKPLHRSDLPNPPINWHKLETHIHSEGFKYAAQKEFHDLESRGTWELVDQSSTSSRPLPLKWVFTYKYDTDGYLDRYKARICVRGDLQPFSDRDNYAATLAAKVFRALMAIAARFDLEAVQMDAISAFTNGILDEEVYTYLPDGFKIPGKLLRLQRALYGLRRSPLIWLQEFSKTLIQLGLLPIPESQCLFTNGRITVFFYVDDMVILYHKTHQLEFKVFKQALLRAYDFKDLGELKWFLGIRILRDRTPGQERLWLCQDSYIEKVAKSFKLTDSAQFKTPLAVEKLTSNIEQATPQEIHAYQSRIGSTTYATSITRPDAARASNKLAEFLLNPSPAHLKAANRLIKYLYDTRYLAIEYSSNQLDSSEPEPEFRCSTDAAFADDLDTRKSTEGYIFKLFGGPIDWRSTKQKQVTRSSTEAELVALSHASTEIYWWRRFFTLIQLQLEEYQVECDNQQTIRLLTTPAIKLATKLKHIDIHHHWLRQEVQDQRLQLKWIPTNSMPADGLTKALPTQKHYTFIQQLGLVDIQHLIQM